jgi:hypothetical protein
VDYARKFKQLCEKNLGVNPSHVSIIGKMFYDDIKTQKFYKDFKTQPCKNNGKDVGSTLYKSISYFIKGDLARRFYQLYQNHKYGCQCASLLSEIDFHATGDTELTPLAKHWAPRYHHILHGVCREMCPAKYLAAHKRALARLAKKALEAGRKLTKENLDKLALKELKEMSKAAQIVDHAHEVAAKAHKEELRKPDCVLHIPHPVRPSVPETTAAVENAPADVPEEKEEEPFIRRPRNEPDEVENRVSLVETNVQLGVQPPQQSQQQYQASPPYLEPFHPHPRMAPPPISYDVPTPRPLPPQPYDTHRAIHELEDSQRRASQRTTDAIRRQQRAFLDMEEHNREHDLIRDNARRQRQLDREQARRIAANWRRNTPVGHRATRIAGKRISQDETIHEKIGS